MKIQIPFVSLSFELNGQGVAVERVTRDRYVEIKVEPQLPAWLQAADAFVPGSWQLAETPVRRPQNKFSNSEKVGRKARRHSF